MCTPWQCLQTKQKNQVNERKLRGNNATSTLIAKDLSVLSLFDTYMLPSIVFFHNFRVKQLE